MALHLIPLAIKETMVSILQVQITSKQYIPLIVVLSNSLLPSLLICILQGILLNPLLKPKYIMLIRFLQLEMLTIKMRQGLPSNIFFLYKALLMSDNHCLVFNRFTDHIFLNSSKEFSDIDIKLATRYFAGFLSSSLYPPPFVNICSSHLAFLSTPGSFKI